MKQSLWVSSDLNDSADVPDWLPNEYLAELKVTLVSVAPQFHNELEMIYNNADAANKELVEIVDKATEENQKIIAQLVVSDDKINDLLGSKHTLFEDKPKLEIACSLIDQTQIIVNTSNAKAKQCTEGLRQNLYPTLDDINTRLAEVCKFNDRTIAPEFIPEKLKSLQQLAFDIGTGLVVSSDRKMQLFSDFRQCLTNVMSDTEFELGKVYDKLNEM